MDCKTVHNVAIPKTASRDSWKLEEIFLSLVISWEDWDVVSRAG